MTAPAPAAADVDLSKDAGQIEIKKGAAGGGAAAASYLQKEEKEGKAVDGSEIAGKASGKIEEKAREEKASSQQEPKAPAGPSSGRPQPQRGAAPDAADVERWHGIMLGIRSSSGSSDGQERQWASLGAQLQKTAAELLALGRTLGLGEEQLRKAVCENLFQDSAVAATSSTSGAPPDQEKDDDGSHLAVGREQSERGSIQGLLFKHMPGGPNQVYLMDVALGQGTFGFVCKATHKLTSQVHAVKAVPKSKIKPEELWAEIGVMKLLDHPHIMRLYGTFEDENQIYMASEICSGGELFDSIEGSPGGFSERTASRLFRQILSAVSYLHGRSIAHRDIKPENFLVSKKVEPSQLHLKMIDFGTAKNFESNPLVTKVCTAHYVAPEVLKRGETPYTEKVDVWSCGVVLYMMLCGFMPFHHHNDLELLKLVKKGKFSFKPERHWECISDSCKDIITNTMCFKTVNRLTAVQAYQHEWFKHQASPTTDGKRASHIDEQMMMLQMRTFLQQNRLKRVALQIIARQVCDDSIEKLRAIFLSVDKDHSGTLTTDEMDVALVQLNVPPEVRDSFREIMMCLDQDGSGVVEYTEFLAATITEEQYLKEDVCRAAFHTMDVDGDGILSRQDIEKFAAGGRETGLSKSAIKEIDEIIHQIDEDGNGQITFEEFMGLMALDSAPITANVACVRSVRRHEHGGAKEQRATLLQNDLSDINNYAPSPGASPCASPIPSDHEGEEEAKQSK